MRKALFLFIFSCSLLVFVAGVWSASLDLRLVQQNVNIGDEITIELNIEQVADLKGINIFMSFDNLKLEYKSHEKGDLIKDFSDEIVPEPVSANRSGKFEYMAVIDSPGPGVSSSRERLLSFRFVAKSPGEAWVKAGDVMLVDSIAKIIPCEMGVSSITISIGQIFALKRVFNYPNPAPDASGKTVIRCESLAILDDLEADIYDISGELVKSIKYQDFDISKAPVYEYQWDCKNEDGQDVANGVYILWLKAKLGSNEKGRTWKIAVIR